MLDMELVDLTEDVDQPAIEGLQEQLASIECQLEQVASAICQPRITTSLLAPTSPQQGGAQNPALVHTTAVSTAAA